ncbi:GYF domain-containing protein [Planctomycetota bacterium]
MSNLFYIRLRDQVRGPFDSQKLRLLARRGRFGRHYQVSVDGTTWESAGEHPDLFPPVQKTAPVRPTDPVDELKRVPDGENSSEKNEQAIEVGENLVNSGAQDDWYVLRSDEQEGPFAFEHVQMLAETGRLDGESYLWVDGMSDWILAKKVEGVFSDHHLKRLDEISSARTTATKIAPMAVASLVLGLLGTSVLFFFGSILAVVFGHIGLKQIRLSEGQLSGKGMAIAGLIFGYTVLTVAIVVGLAAIATLLLRGIPAGN